MMQKSLSPPTSKRGNREENALPEVSARVALLTPLDQIEDMELLRAIGRKLQQIGLAKGPNDPSLS